MSEQPGARGTHDELAAHLQAERQTALRALQVLEYALTAPPPRRHRTWVHRVRVAVDALYVALQAQLSRPDDPLRLLDEIALAHPALIERIERLQQDLLDLTIAVASLSEHLEDDSTIVIDPTDVRERLGALATRFHRHQEGEAKLVYEAIGRTIDEIC